MTERAQPCPKCGRREVEMIAGGGKWGVSCWSGCRFAGPVRDTPEHALAAWNAEARPGGAVKPAGVVWVDEFAEVPVDAWNAIKGKGA